MLNERDILVWEQHYRDLLRETEQDRVAHQSVAPKEPARLRQRALASLGAYLVALGCNLRRRYAFASWAADGASLSDNQPAADCGCGS